MAEMNIILCVENLLIQYNYMFVTEIISFSYIIIAKLATKK